MEEFFRNSTAHGGLTKVEVRGVDDLVTFEDSFLDGILDEFPIHALNAALSFRSMIRGAEKWAWVTEDLLEDPSIGEATLWYYHRTLDYDAWEKLQKISLDFEPYDKGVISLWIGDIWGQEIPEDETQYPVKIGLESLPYNLLLAVWP